jgi:hypothetical protein
MNFKKLAKSKLIRLLVVAPILMLTLVVGYIKSLEVDPLDLLDVKSPVENSTITGNVKINVKFYDDDQTSLSTRTQIYDSRCQQKLRTIQITTRVSKQDTFQVINWNTVGAYQDGSALADGNYCLRICADYKLDSTPYEACNLRVLTIRNRTNRAPVITSKPTTTATEGNNYKYQITATDADSDPVTFALLKSPSFLKLNGGVLSGTNLPAGTYQVSIEARDNFGGKASQNFTLVVNKKDNSTPPTTPQVGEIKLEIIKPQDGDTFTGRENKLEWALENAAAVSELNIEFGSVQNGEVANWTKLTTIPKDRVATQTSANWDVRAITPGDYRIRIRVIDTAGLEKIAQSGVVKVLKSDEPTTSIEDITVTDLSPFNGEAIKETKPQITASITSKQALAEGDITLTINDEIKPTCKLEKKEDTKYQLTCELSEDLKPGNYKVKLAISDSAVKGGYSKEWRFTVLESKVVPGDDADTITIPIINAKIPKSVANILAIIIAALLCLLLLPLLLLTIWRRRRSKYYTEQTTTTTGGGGGSTDKQYDPFASYDQPATEVSEHSITEQNTDSRAIAPVEAPVPVTETITTTNKVEEPAQKNWFGRKVDEFNQKRTEMKQLREQKAAAKAVETPTTKTDSEPLAPVATKPAPTSAASSLLGNDMALQDNDPTDNPLAPVVEKKPENPMMPVSPDPIKQAIPQTPIQNPQQQARSQPEQSAVVQPQVQSEPLASVPATASTTTVSTPSAAQADDSLPAWLKDDSTVDESAPVNSQGVATSTTTTQTSSSDEDTDDGSDPYGFGDYSLGEPE